MSSSSPSDRNLARSCKENGDSLYRQLEYNSAAAQYTRTINLLTAACSINGKLSSEEDEKILYTAHSNRSACYLQLSKFSEALLDADRAVQLRGDWAKGHIRRAGCLARLKRFSDAKAAYETALRLEPGNSEAQRGLAKVTESANSSPGANLRDQFGTVMKNLSVFLSKALSQALSFWANLSSDTQKGVGIVTGLLLLYYFFIYRPSYYADPYSYSYGGGYGYGGYESRGLSWFSWLAIMYAAYAVPPMLGPDVLGAYARPFFGMNMTTFMWLLNMFTSQRRSGFGGFGGMPGGYGGGYGMPFGRRRYY